MKSLSYQKQTGLTLVELMIALLIGIAIVGGVMSAFITTNRSVVLNDALSRNQETGRFALEYISQYARMAGYNESLDRGMDLPLYISSSSSELTVDCTAADADACAGNDMAGIRGDRISFPYYASEQAITDCMGGSAGGVNPAALLVNVFWVDTDGVLRCHVFDADTKAWIGSSVPLVTGVETMEMLIGVADDGGISVSRYLTVDQIATNNLSFAVRSVRIALLLSSEEEDATNASGQQRLDTNVEKRSYSVLDKRMPEYEDGNLRHVFTTTVSFLNINIDSF